MLWAVVLEKILTNPSDCKEIKPVNPKGNESWMFIRRTDAEAETPVLWPPDAKSWLVRKDCDAGKDWRQEEKRTTEEQRMRWLDGITVPLDMSLSKLQEMVKDRETWHVAVHGSQRVRHNWATDQQQKNWWFEKSCPLTLLFNLSFSLPYCGCSLLCF